MVDVIVKNGLVIDRGEKTTAHLAIKDGKVVAWLQNPDDMQAKEVIDCAGKYILPGIVDMHFHCRVPGKSEREDFDTATMAASKGGVTMFVEMPIAKPSPHNAETFKNRVDYAADKAVIDYAFYGAGAMRNEEAAAELARAGAIGYKMFLHAMPSGREDEFHGLCAVNNEEVFESLQANGKTGLITCVHAEDDGYIKALTKIHDKGDDNTFLEHFATRVPEAEELAILTSGLIAKGAGAKLHICHVSSAEGADAVAYLKEKGIDITAESCPHYLFGDEKMLTHFGTYAKVNPPVRGQDHQDALLAALYNGVLDAIASDHAPFLPEEKEVKDFLKAPSGMPIVELFGPVVFDQVMKGNMGWEEAIEWLSANPAKLLNVYPQKGTLAVGADADFLIFDPNQDTVVDVDKALTRSKGSMYPFHHKVYKGLIDATYVRGVKVYADGAIHAPRGHGNFIPGKGYQK